jgi:hypothetical protein
VVALVCAGLVIATVHARRRGSEEALPASVGVVFDSGVLDGCFCAGSVDERLPAREQRLVGGAPSK